MKVEIANGRSFNETPVAADVFTSGDIVEGILRDYSQDRDTFYIVANKNGWNHFVSLRGDIMYSDDDRISDWIVAESAKIVVEF